VKTTFAASLLLLGTGCFLYYYVDWDHVEQRSADYHAGGASQEDFFVDPVSVGDCDCEVDYPEYEWVEANKAYVACSDDAEVECVTVDGQCWFRPRGCGGRPGFPQLSCQDGPEGPGCYINAASGSTYTDCEQEGSCANGEPIEYCIEWPRRVSDGCPAEQTSEYGNYWDCDNTRTYLKVGEEIVETGSVGGASGSYHNRLSEVCHEERETIVEQVGERVDDFGFGGGSNVSSECADFIGDAHDAVADTTGDDCVNACVDDYLDCLESSDCAYVESCADSYGGCIGGCL
jgi:hypothetical protein